MHTITRLALSVATAAGLLALVLGCDRKPAKSGHDDHAAHGGGDEHTPLLFFVWNDRYELFGEHPPLVAGEPAGFLIHVTDQASGEPRREGPVTFVLRRGEGASTEITAASPRRPGIYAPEVTFPEAGAWSVTIRIPGENSAAPHEIPLPDLTVHATHEEEHRAEAPPPPKGITFLKEQQWNMGTRVETAKKGRIVERLRVAATIVARPASRAAVATPLSGRLVAPGRNPFPGLGDRVVAGQPLAWVQPPFSETLARTVEAEADVVRSRLALEQADLMLARVRKLAQEKAKSERELQESESAQRMAKAQHEAAVALREAYRRSGAIFVDVEPGLPPAIELRAPISGIIVEVSATIGEQVDPEHPVLRILDPTTVHLETQIPESDLARVAIPLAASYIDPLDPGRVVPVPSDAPPFLSPEMDVETRTFRCVYAVPNPEGRLRLGMSVTALLETRRAEEAVAIPLAAVVDVDGADMAYVQISGETFEQRTLRLGIRDGDRVQILEGITAGDRVVARAAYAIRLASVAASIPVHAH